MRRRQGFLPLAILLLVPVQALAQLTVVRPRAGAESSYRRTVLQWLPMPGATEYHLQVDDDPAFRSPEVDVVVDDPMYELRGERLRLNGQLSWPAYVRVNGVRWSAPVFSPGYFTGAFWPELAVGADGKVFYGYLGGEFGDAFAAVRTSDDFSRARRMVLPNSNGNPDGLALGVDAAGVAHAYWTDQIFGTPAVPIYANSIDWTPRRLGDQVFGAAEAGASMVISGANINVFDEAFRTIRWFTSRNGGQTFASTSVPHSDGAIAATATADGPGQVLIVQERLGGSGRELVLQRSANAWTPEIIGRGRWPSAVVGSDGTIHVLARSDLNGEVSYSNSARAFATWTRLPVHPVFNQQLLPIVVDEARQRLYAATPDPLGTTLCAATTAGDSWTCRPVGGWEAKHPDLKIDSTGVLHVAWADVRGGGYATSLGSFLAVNRPPDAALGSPVFWPNTVIVPSFAHDGDGDAVSGFVAVGISELRRRRVLEGDSLPVLGHEVFVGRTGLGSVDSALLFRVPGADWRTIVPKDDLALPATVAVRTIEGRFVDTFTIVAWDFAAATIDHFEFTAHVREPFNGATLPSMDLSTVPAGLLTMRVSLTDGASVRAYDRRFLRVPGQNHLAAVDFRPRAESFTTRVDEVPAENFRAPSLREALKAEMTAVVFAIERALITPDPALRSQLLHSARSILRIRVIARVSGCAAGGTPDDDDWVIDCGNQAALVAAALHLDEAIALLL